MFSSSSSSYQVMNAGQQSNCSCCPSNSQEPEASMWGRAGQAAAAVTLPVWPASRVCRRGVESCQSNTNSELLYLRRAATCKKTASG